MKKEYYHIVDINGNHILWVKAKIIKKLHKKGKLCKYKK